MDLRGSYDPVLWKSRCGWGFIERKLRDTVRMNLALAAAEDPSFKELKYLPNAQGIFIFLYIYTF